MIASMGGSFEDQFNLKQSAQKYDNEALQRIMAIGSETETSTMRNNRLAQLAQTHPHMDIQNYPSAVSGSVQMHPG